MRASDLMTRPVHTVRIDTPVEQAAALLTRQQITALPVSDKHGRLVGILSEADLLTSQVQGVEAASALWDGDAGTVVGHPRDV
jgi:CBS-domain-containing membrane protein